MSPQTPAERQRAYRARKGAATGQRGPAPTQPHGTLAAYRRHRRRDETPCDACRLAYNAWHRERYRRSSKG